MSSPGQKRGSCGHAMAIFDGHAFCARCREKGKGEEPCIANKDTADCTLCNSFTTEQCAQISTPSYKIKKEKRDAKRVDNTQPTDELVDPSRVSVIGVVSGPSADKSPAPPEKKPKKDKPPTKSKKSAPSSATEDKFSALEDKWADCFNRLEALLLARSIEPTFSSDVRVVPDPPPPGNVTRGSEPFFQPSDKPLDTSQRTGPDSSAALQPSAGKLSTDPALQGSSTVKCTGPDNIASKQKSAGKLKAKPNISTQGRTGPDTGLRSKSRLVSLVPTLTDLQLFLLRHPTTLPPTDLIVQPAPFHRPLRRAGKTVSLVWTRIPRVSSPTLPRWNFS